MSRKSKANDRINLGTGVAPLIVTTILCCEAQVYNSFFFLEQPFYENHPTIDPIQDPSPVKMAFKTVNRSIVYGSTKIELL